MCVLSGSVRRKVASAQAPGEAASGCRFSRRPARSQSAVGAGGAHLHQRQVSVGEKERNGRHCARE